MFCSKFNIAAGMFFFKHALLVILSFRPLQYMAVCQNLVPLVNIKIVGKWTFIPLKMVLIGIDPPPYTTITRFGFMNFVNFHEHPRDHAAGVSGAVHVAGLGGKDANQQHSDQSGQHA